MYLVLLQLDAVARVVIARMLVMQRMLRHTLLMACCKLPKLEGAVTSAEYGVCNNTYAQYGPKVSGSVTEYGVTPGRRG
jgi:hypothetical protein